MGYVLCLGSVPKGTDRRRGGGGGVGGWVPDNETGLKQSLLGACYRDTRREQEQQEPWSRSLSPTQRQLCTPVPEQLFGN